MNIFVEVIKGIIKALNSSNKKLRYAIVIAIGAASVALGIALAIQIDKSKTQLAQVAVGVFSGIAILLGLSVSIYEENKAKEKREQKIETLEREVIEKPRETKSAWELATLKLESYLNKNLQQVSAIFYLSVTVMLVGFALIIFGIIKVYNAPTLLNPSILSTVAGIIINFIGATFLLIYRSTTRQARNYMDVLERINAVGMSIQILENISSEKKGLKDDTTAEIAKELLKLYGDLKTKSA